MVAKVEVSERGFNRRFVVTNRQDLTAGQLYDHYMRGQCFVKAFKKDLAMDRLSCHRFLANQFRLFIQDSGGWEAPAGAKSEKNRQNNRRE